MEHAWRTGAPHQADIQGLDELVVRRAHPPLVHTAQHLWVNDRTLQRPRDGNGFCAACPLHGSHQHLDHHLQSDVD